MTVNFNPKWCLWWTNLKSGPPQILLIILISTVWFFFLKEYHRLDMSILSYHQHLIFFSFSSFSIFSSSLIISIHSYKHTQKNNGLNQFSKLRYPAEPECGSGFFSLFYIHSINYMRLLFKPKRKINPTV